MRCSTYARRSSGGVKLTGKVPAFSIASAAWGCRGMACKFVSVEGAIKKRYADRYARRSESRVQSWRDAIVPLEPYQYNESAALRVMISRPIPHRPMVQDRH